MVLVRTALSGLLLIALPSFGSELIHLTTGFDLEAQSHVVNGASLTLRTLNGTIEVPQREVAGIDVQPEAVPQQKTSPQPPVTDLLSLISSVAGSQARTPEFIRFVQCVARVESALQENARSPKGAIGLMQLMPGTAKDLGVIPTNTADNIKGGAKYLRELLIRYHNDSVLALAAYNAGPSAVKKFGGVPPYLETRRYIEKVLREYSRLETSVPAPAKHNP